MPGILTRTMTLAEEYIAERRAVLQGDCPWEGKRELWWTPGTFSERLSVREEFIKDFGFAIPTIPALQQIAKLGPLLEVGAGSGYWAHELSGLGADIIATDIAPGVNPEHNVFGFRKAWHPVERLTAVQAVHKYPGRNLLIVWPNYKEGWAAKAVKSFTGDTVIYVGEGEGGCTGNSTLYYTLNRYWYEADWITIPQFWGVHDVVRIYKRRVPE